MKLVSYLRRAAVLGGGKLGPLLAAHLANAGVEVWLYDLPADSGEALALLRQRIDALHRQSPPALATASRAGMIHPMCLGEGLETLRHCDLVIEAVVEDLDVKSGLYVRITPFLASDAILVTTTSSLSVNALAQVLPEVLRWRFCGLHVLFPPRTTPLAELVPNDFTDPRVLDQLETFLVSDLGKQVIRVRDRPFYVAGRLALYTMLLACHHGERLGLPPDQVDALSGTLVGRAPRGSFGLMDLVGLETIADCLRSAWQRLPEDAWLARLGWPAWLAELTARGMPIYRRETTGMQVWDPALANYRPTDGALAAVVRTALAIPDPARRWAALRAEAHPQARFLWAVQADLYHYAANWLGEIADSARDLDLALRWGLGWREGPLESWQQSGWREVADWLAADIQAGQTLVNTPLPDWVAQVQGVHGPRGSLALPDKRLRCRSALAVYRRQLLPDRLVGESPIEPGDTVWQQGQVRLLDSGEEIGIVDASAAPAALDSRLVETLHSALEQASGRFRGLVLWRAGGVFCQGADLTELLSLLDRGDHVGLARVQQRWAAWLDACRDLPLPVVAAVHGRCCGPGAELLLYCDRVVASLDSRFALGMPTPGLPPGAGGLTALARRVYRQAGVEGLPWLLRSWAWLASGRLAGSSLEARELGLLQPADVVLMNPAELLHTARCQAQALACSAYRAPVELPLAVPGREGLAVLHRQIARWREAGELTAREIPRVEGLARVLVGAEVAAGELLSEAAHRQLEARQWLAWLSARDSRERLVEYLEGSP